MSRRYRVCAAVAAAALVVSVGAQPASATSTSTGASGFASAAYTGSASMKASLTITGALGGLLGSLLTPIVTNLLNPVVAALTGTASSAIGAVLGPASSFHAASPTVQTGPAPAAFPTDLPAGLPSPCTGSSTTQPCYSATGSGAVNASPLASVTLGAVSGYTQQVTTAADATSPIFGRAQEASASISILPAISTLTNPIVSTGLVDSKANCPNNGTSAPSASVSASNVQLLGGLVKLTVGSSSGAISSLTFNGTTYASLNALPTVTAGGVTVQPYGDAVIVSLSLSLSQILAGLGIPSSITSTLLGYGNSGTSLTLSLVIGPNTTVTNTSATAWGLGVGVDLSGSLSFSLPTGSAGTPIVGASISIPTGITGSTFGNLLDLRLAYSACAVGATSTGATQVIPPQLI